MINIWLKIRKRYQLDQDPDFILRHLNFWLDLFSDRALYKIWIYNEDFNMPEEFAEKIKDITILNRTLLLENEDCKYIFDEIGKSVVISEWWKATAFALAAPFFYFKEEQYIFNIDADDMKLDGPALEYLMKAYNFAVSEKLDTISYDVLYSRNGLSVELPNVWTFGVNIGSTYKMRNVILTNIHNTEIKGQGAGLSLDLIIDHHLKSVNNYVAFITPDKLHHMEVNTTRFDVEKNLVEVGHHGHLLHAEQLPKLLLVK